MCDAQRVGLQYLTRQNYRVPVQVLLTGMPLAAGLFTITGCRVTAMGVSWKQPWLPRSAFLGQTDTQQKGPKDQDGHAQVTGLNSPMRTMF